MPTPPLYERILWAVGVLCVGGCIAVAVQASVYSNRATHIEHQSPKPLSVNLPPDQPIGRIEIPALNLSAPIAPDIDAGSLRKGVGHIHGTALPGGLGTVGLAAHRDSYFKPLQRITPGMDIRLTDVSGTFHYLVDSTEIVTPDKVSVLDIADRPKLTLITCFPFDYVGAAPRRFIVHAHLLSAAPDSKLSLP
jgi:LPXTG-site transpeptidase (sortase) family protein